MKRGKKAERRNERETEVNNITVKFKDEKKMNAATVRRDATEREGKGGLRNEAKRSDK